MKAELKTLANESFSEQFEELKRRGLVLDQTQPIKKSNSSLEREIETLKITVAELKGINTLESPNREYSPNRDIKNNREDDNMEEASPAYTRGSSRRIRSPTSTLAPVFDDRNAMFVFGSGGVNARTYYDESDISNLNNFDRVPATEESSDFKPKESSSHQLKEMQTLFAPPQNLDESDYTLLRVFNPIKYPSKPRKKFTSDRIDEIQMNKLKLELSIHKHRNRLEYSKLMRQPPTGPAASARRRINPARRFNSSSSNSVESYTNDGNENISDDQTLRMLVPILDHFAPSSPNHSSGTNQIIVVKPSPSKKSYEETVYMVESRPISRTSGMLQSQQQTSVSKVADLTVEQFNQITEK